ncbi:hypothetical protein [Nocardioides sp.]|uniref:hypothetical protein n=1 Tax=Nocardioides sp. TaxID=35761 RepID=UPI002EDB81B9
MDALMRIRPGLYRGTVDGEESGHCSCLIEVRRLTDHALSLDYEAVGSEGIQHVEHTIITGSALHVTMGEFPDVVMFREGAPGVFVADPSAPLPMQIHPGVDAGTLTWAWHWAPPGEEPREQSRATAQFEHELAPRAPRRQDLGALIGLLATLEGELTGIGAEMPEWAERLARRLARDGAAAGPGNREVRQGLNDLNHRLRCALGEYDGESS